LPAAQAKTGFQGIRLDSRAVGGCRPVELTAALAPHRWRIRERLVVTRWALGSEVMLAERL
jgi:hypothetical protein